MANHAGKIFLLQLLSLIKLVVPEIRNLTLSILNFCVPVHFTVYHRLSYKYLSFHSGGEQCCHLTLRNISDYRL